MMTPKEKAEQILPCEFLDTDFPCGPTSLETCGPCGARPAVIATLSKAQAERDELKAEIERLKNLDEIGIKAHNANLLEMADMRAVIHRLKADATYHRNKVDELATLTSQLRAERDAAFGRGLERARNLLLESGGIKVDQDDALVAEIDKAKAE